MTFFQEKILKLRQLVTRSTLQAKLFSFVVNAQPYADVVQHSRNNGSFNNLKVRHAHKFSHQKGCSTHNRRHQLTACRSSSFNSACKSRTVTQLFHHRNGKGTSAGDVTNGAAGYCTHEAGGKNGNLCRTACCPACDGVGNVNEEFTQTCSFQVSTKKNKQVDEGGGYTHRCTKNTFSSKIQVVKHFLHANTAVC